MIRYKSSKQISIEEFKTPFVQFCEKSKTNRWVKLATILPWDELANIYYKKLSLGKGAPSKDARIIIGAIIIKHKLKLDDRGTIEIIKENAYMQYFLGLSTYTEEEVFDASLFPTIRKRLGVAEFNSMNDEIISKALGEKFAKAEESQDNQENSNNNTTEKKNKGKLKLDATVADAHIKYPTDVDVLNDSREKLELIIDMLYKKQELSKKPRTYRKQARKDFLNFSKKKQKTVKESRRAVKKQIGYVKRDIKIINGMLDKYADKGFPFSKKEMQLFKYFYVSQYVLEQQTAMYETKTHSHPDRIVNIHQPYVRPIVRGKAKSKVEFGAKINLSLQDGFTKIDHFDWNAYNEGTDLVSQVEAYKKLYGYYPKLVQVDKIYLNSENRKWLKERNIRHIGSPLGRPVKEPLTAYQKRKQRKEYTERNHIEGKIGQGKDGYNLNNIRARLSKTSASWISAIIFVMNLVKFFKDFLLSFFYNIFWVAEKSIKYFFYFIFQKNAITFNCR
jgi:transposase, IS5 family